MCYDIENWEKEIEGRGYLMADMIAASKWICSFEGKERLLYSDPTNPYESIYIRAKISDGKLTITDSECEHGPDGGWSRRIITFDKQNTIKAIALLMENNTDPLQALKKMLGYNERTMLFREACVTAGIEFKNQLSF